LRFLRRKGYKIIARNFSSPVGEIDIIARQGREMVFIEVKARSSPDFGWPEEAISREKIKHLFRAAQFYIKRNAHSEEIFRFDVVSIIFGEKPQITLIKDAF